MAEVVRVDDKGRLVLPKAIRERAHIGQRTKLIAEVSGVGRVELTDAAMVVAKAQEIGRRKLAGWKEEEHEATSYVMRMMKERK